MRESDRPRFGLLLQAMAAAFRAEVTEALLLGYEMGLDDLELAQVERAIKRGMRECQFMPTVAELRELAKDGGGPPYYRPLLPELERIERCHWHELEEIHRGPNPDGPVWFCRVCKRLDKPRLGNGQPQHIGELLARVAPPGKERR